ncbi:MAG: hypothetical protein N3B01_07020, partial [Verrucomicrobiae bacterium]|nr:hypothetical protein [Verrucomicrobiae bacterium]
MTKLRQILWRLGSLKLAVVLLTLLAVVLAGATFYESRSPTAEVMRAVYRSWWFNGLLGALALNLIMATVVRWPWRRHQTGFVVTHAGLVMIVGGCSAAFHFGTEGMMPLRVGEPPTDLVQLEEYALTVRSSSFLQVRLRPDRRGKVRPQKVSLADGLTLELEKFHPNARAEVVVREGGVRWHPAVQIRWYDAGTKKSTQQWLLAGSSAVAGLELVVARDTAELTRLTNAPPAEAQLLVQYQRRYLEIAVEENLGREVRVPDTDLSVRVLNYWPDFRIGSNRELMTVSREPNNPVVLLTLVRGEDMEQMFVFAGARMEPLVRQRTGSPIGARVELLAPVARPRLLLIALAGAEKLYYAAAAKGTFRTGEVGVGEPLKGEWLADHFWVERFVTNAVVEVHAVGRGSGSAQQQAALRVRVGEGDASRRVWVWFGQAVEL